MSKIEDALKKAIDSGVAKYPGEIVSTDSENNNAPRSISKELISFDGSRRGIVKRSVSVKEIALMKNDNLLKAKDLSELKVIHSDMQENKVANTYRDLRTKILQKTNGNNAKVLITSCVPGMENSSTVLNLATAFSFDESKTSMIVDCNITNPEIDKLLKVNPGHGLVDYLEDEEISVEDVIHETGIQRLRMIPAGVEREVATEYFTSHRMRGLMTDLFSRYPDRYIFVNSAPITDSADTRILVELCDYVLLVVPYGKTSTYKIKESVDSIGRDKLLGVVFSDTPKLPNVNMLKTQFSDGFGIVFAEKLKLIKHKLFKPKKLVSLISNWYKIK